MLLAIEGIDVIQGGYTPDENQFVEHCQRCDSFDDRPVPGWSREEEITNCLKWEMEEVYPKDTKQLHRVPSSCIG